MPNVLKNLLFIFASEFYNLYEYINQCIIIYEYNDTNVKLIRKSLTNTPFRNIILIYSYGHISIILFNLTKGCEMDGKANEFI